jgi:hypothetical protein
LWRATIARDGRDIRPFRRRLADSVVTPSVGQPFGGVSFASQSLRRLRLSRNTCAPRRSPPVRGPRFSFCADKLRCSARIREGRSASQPAKNSVVASILTSPPVGRACSWGGKRVQTPRNVRRPAKTPEARSNQILRGNQMAGTIHYGGVSFEPGGGGPRIGLLLPVP